MDRLKRNYRLKIILDYGEAPIWTKYYDEKLWTLNDDIQDIYSSFYKIDYKDEPVYFDKEKN